VEKEKLCFRAHIHGIAHLAGRPDSPAQNVAGVPLERSAVRIVNVANQPGHRAVPGLPGKDHECRRVGPKVHVGLFNAHKTLNGRTVKHQLPIQGLIQLFNCNGNIF